MLPAEAHPAAIRSFLETRTNRLTHLRLATVADAGFILALRTDPTRSRHISKTDASLEVQAEWMRDYEKRFEAGQEAYFIIRHEGADVGTARIYDYRPAEDSFCWGSWIIRPGTPPGAAMGTPVAIYDLGFDYLCFSSAHFDIRKDNRSVWKFEEVIGARLVGADDENRCYVYSKASYEAARPRLERYISNQHEHPLP